MRAYDRNGEWLETYVNTTVPYNGTRYLDIYDDHETAMLEIEAEGEWTVELQPTTFDNFVPRALLTPGDPDYGNLSTPSERSGKGDEVLFIVGDATAIHGTHKGSSNFIVLAVGGPARRTVFNEIGDYDGKAVRPLDAMILLVLTEGEWTIELE